MRLFLAKTTARLRTSGLKEMLFFFTDDQLLFQEDNEGACSSAVANVCSVYYCFINTETIKRCMAVGFLNILKVQLCHFFFNCPEIWMSSPVVLWFSECLCLPLLEHLKRVGVMWRRTPLSGVSDTSVVSSSNGEGRKRTLSSCSNDSLSGGLPLTPRRVSWRQKIFLRVASPMPKPSASMQDTGVVT